jgi:hypothetical protein
MLGLSGKQKGRRGYICCGIVSSTKKSQGSTGRVLWTSGGEICRSRGREAGGGRRMVTIPLYS